ncbi:MAG: L-2-hydroxyglutarate oxidase [Myxococcota bacterium]|nr:L-2-hydroxyglutarate oxidase [Myxococcota bacterium]
MRCADVAVIGGGLVGLSAAWHLLQAGASVIVLEKERRLALHQSGRNSGVLHSGIYYRPGSLKARTCRAGRAAMLQFLAEEGLPHEVCGKVIVATRQEELPQLEELLRRGRANGVRCTRIDPSELRALEPTAVGLAALHVPEAGIADFAAVCRRLAERIQARGGTILLGAAFRALRRQGAGLSLQTDAGAIAVRKILGCAGLQADRVARLCGTRPPVRIVPFRGEYYQLVPGAPRPCRNLIYPVPDPEFPFLGVHLTRRVDGTLECGPNAVLALAREGYGRLSVNLLDVASTLTYPGFLRMARRHVRTGLRELWRSLSKRSFVAALQRLVPSLRAEHLRAAPCGIRAQAVLPDGQLCDDFLMGEADEGLHLYNAPSPAATASLEIGRLAATRLARC